MPDSTRPVHFLIRGSTLTGCIQESNVPLVTDDPGQVTCFACRRSPLFKAAQLGGRSFDPLPQRQAPTLLKEIIASDEQLRDLHLQSLAEIVKRGLNAGTNDAEHEALTDLADALHLTYDDETEKYL